MTKSKEKIHNIIENKWKGYCIHCMKETELAPFLCIKHYKIVHNILSDIGKGITNKKIKDYLQTDLIIKDNFMGNLEQQLHDLRKSIDANIQLAGSYKLQPNQESPDERNQCQREIALAYTRLQEAKMWVGKCLEAIGSELPAEFQDKVV